MTAPLPTASPSSQGVDARGIEAFLDALEGDPRIESHSLMLLRHGTVIAAGWWAPFSRERPQLLYSLSKTFTAAALGFAVEEGLIGLDELVVDAFPEFAAEILTPRARSIRVRHLAAMASGHLEDMLWPAIGLDPAEPVRGFLLHEPEEDPGSVFTYNQMATYTVAAILQRRAGTDLVGYLRPRLLDPLGIDPVSWEAHPADRSLGFSGLFAGTDAIAKLGQLLLDSGRWQGRQLLPEGWVEQISTRWIDTPREPEPDWRFGYGFQVWHSRHGYRGDGAFGQFCVVLPEHDAVLAMTASTEAMQAVLDAVWANLLPAMGGADTDAADAGSSNPGSADVDADADERLAARLAGLRLPVPEGASEPPPGREWAGRYAGTPPTDGPALDAIELTPGDAGWKVHLHDPLGVATEGILAATGWSVSEQSGQPPIALAGGWRDGVLRISVLFVETPHRLELELDAGSRQASSRWLPAAPLQAPGSAGLTELQAPRPLR